MKAIAVFAALLAASSASPQIIYNNGFGGLSHIGHGLTYAAHHGLTYAAAPAVVAAPTVVAAAPAVVPVATKTQYHAQDELGQASFGHSEPTQSHAAVRDAAGGVSGTFSYISPEGIPFTTHYRADHNGYRVASNALPVAPSVSIAGPVDTPEVQAAKAQHFAAVAEAQARSGRKKRGVIAASPFLAHHGLTYAAPAFAYNAHVPHHVSIAHQSPVVKTYSAPVVQTYAAAPVVQTYAAAPAVVAAAPTVVAAAPAVRAATLTRVINTPGHAVSYRVD